METSTQIMSSQMEQFVYLLNNMVLGESSLEDFILFVGTLVAFVAFILWCCFPVTPKEAVLPVLQQLDKKRMEEMAYNQLAVGI